MDLPWHFPDPHEEARRRGQEFQQLSPNQRLRELLDTIETGMVLIRESPNRRMIDQLHLDREAQWQSYQRELFHRHGK